MLDIGSQESFASVDDYVSKLSHKLSTVVEAVKRQDRPGHQNNRKNLLILGLISSIILRER